METIEAISRNEKRFNRSRRLVKAIIGLVIALMVILQYDHLVQLLNWL